ncbi:acetate kinase [uncultured Clostridium sp.]|jgi:acetate kinase|uniref:acetate/propionate family kinase n=1 Tax=uncultured Clostridium sp. TaxID=59620 RepID=UPI002602C241|nr:acetate kinase [uncultured Clostridium sp.]
MNILVVNCGSSSLKYQLINMVNEDVLASGLVERIGTEGSILIQKVEGKEKYIIEKEMSNHKEAIKLVIASLIDTDQGVINSLDEINAVGHRVVHGGEKYAQSVLINDEVMKDLEDFAKLAPLHNPPNIIGIEACKALMPDVAMSVVFDTAFHQTMPEKAFVYALPYELYKEHNIRKYGFHGTSHKYVSAKAAEVLGKDIKELKIVTCHLGNGASIAAVDRGICVETTMGFTPLEGLVMGTRCGSIDPAIVTYLTSELGYSTNEVNNILNKKSGVLGVSGISSDFRDIRAAAENGNHRAQLALDIFYYKIKQFIATSAVAMRGMDVLVFTAGVGENSTEARTGICDGLEFLGITIDEEKNAVRGELIEITGTDKRVKVLAIPTNEEVMIARDTLELVK